VTSNLYRSLSRKRAQPADWNKSASRNSISPHPVIRPVPFFVVPSFCDLPSLGICSLVANLLFGGLSPFARSTFLLVTCPFCPFIPRI
jgi:hypothetical protein